MIELNFNPVIVDGESITEIKRENGTGDLTIPFIVFNEYQFFLEFEIRKVYSARKIELPIFNCRPCCACLIR